MTKLEAIRAANKKLVESRPLVAVFVGATSGIGSYTLLELAKTHGTVGQGLRVYLVGRKQHAATKIFAQCREHCPKGDFRFVPGGDLSLMRDVHGACKEIVQQEGLEADGRIDVLVMSQGMLLFGDRKETVEGLDTSMSLLYYSRLRLVTLLMPLLLATESAAHIISVYAGGYEGKLFADDLSLRQPGHYSFANCRSHVVYMKTLVFEKLAQEHAGKLALVHVFPGVVMTNGFSGDQLPGWFKIMWTVAKPFARLMSVPTDECGQKTLNLATDRYPASGERIDQSAEVAIGTDGTIRSGAYAVQDGKAVIVTMAYEETKLGMKKKELKENVWKYTMDAFATIESEGIFRS